jgi:hypothetical protein
MILSQMTRMSLQLQKVLKDAPVCDHPVKMMEVASPAPSPRHWIMLYESSMMMLKLLRQQRFLNPKAQFLQQLH